MGNPLEAKMNSVSSSITTKLSDRFLESTEVDIMTTVLESQALEITCILVAAEFHASGETQSTLDPTLSDPRAPPTPGMNLTHLGASVRHSNGANRQPSISTGAIPQQSEHASIFEIKIAAQRMRFRKYARFTL